ncbi:hypothetical protein B9479_007895 [Cryptococcus floricola]|uniref:Uncharacterized protein n=1 Tax=Cryptococcus floricola TaxID=2591691 RepID=A0A5D3AMB3_9TREE|nr:hypothetical protein B9479_007895 [Cryptococcus floricola]
MLGANSWSFSLAYRPRHCSHNHLAINILFAINQLVKRQSEDVIGRWVGHRQRVSSFEEMVSRSLICSTFSSLRSVCAPINSWK